MLRHAAVVVAAVYLSFAAVTEGEMEGTSAMEDVTLVSQMKEMLGEANGPPAEGERDAFNEIQGFSLKAGATVLKGKSMAACENVCLQEAECRSFSYRLKDEECIWSTASLVFDPDFMFGSKSENPAAHKKYRVFAGMSYRTQGWTIVAGMTQGECEAMCSGTNKCKAYSYRARDKLCLLGPKGIAYSMDFNYFEKKGIPYEPFPLLPPGGTYKCTGSLCPPEKEAKEEPEPATNDPRLKSMENTVKITEVAADQEMAKAKSMEASDKATMKRDTLKEKAELAELKDKDFSQLSDQEQKLVTADNERLAKEEETLKLDAANAEIEDKARANGKSVEEFKEHATKQAWTTEQRAQSAKDRELKEGHKATEMMLENMAAKDAEFKAIQEMMKAKNADADAALEEVRKNAEDSWINEKEEKKVAKEKKELKVKAAGMNAATEVMLKIDSNRAKGIAKDNDESMNKRSVEAQQKDALTGQERARKMAEGTKQKEKIAKKERAQIQKEMSGMENKIKEGKEEMSEVEAKKYVTLSIAHAKASQAANEIAAKAANATEYQAKVTMRAKNHGEKLQKLNEAELLKVKEKADKKVAMVQHAEQAAAGDSSEAAAKAMSNATKAASEKEEQDAEASEGQREELLKKEEEQAAASEKEKKKVEAAGNEKIAAMAKEAAQKEAKAADKSESEVSESQKKKEQAEAAADAEAKEMKVKADAAAYKAVRELKTKSMEQQGMVERVITSDVAAFVDSGEGELGTDLETAKQNQMVTQQRAADTLTALENAKTELENAKAAQKQAEVDHAAQQNAKAIEEKGKGDEGKEDAEEETKDAAPIVSAAGSAAGSAGDSNAAPASRRFNDLTADDEAFFTTSLLELESGEGSNSRLHHEKTVNKRLDDSWADPTFGNTDMHLLLDTDSLGASAFDSQAPVTLIDPNGNKTEAELQLEKHLAEQKALDDAKEAKEKLKSTPGTPEEKAHKEVIQKKVDAEDEMTAKAVAKARVGKGEKDVEEKELAYESAKTAANEAKASVKAMINAPSNVAFGEEADMQGELRILAADDWVMNAYMKFPLSTLKETDTLVEGTLKLYKFGGGTGPIKVHIASCGWSRRDVTYTMAEVNPGGFTLDLASVGDDTAELPEKEKTWFNVRLSGDTIQSARLEGTHVCMKISGGPADSYAVISSEMTDKKPELILYAKEGPLPGDGTKPADQLTEDDHKKIKERGRYRLAQKKKITEEETTAAKKTIVDMMNSPDGQHTKLLAEKEALENDPFAGLSQEELEGERDAAVEASLEEKLIPVKAQMLQNQGTLLKTQLTTVGIGAPPMPLTEGTPEYQEEYDKQMADYEEISLPPLVAVEREKLKTDVVLPAEEQKMKDKISAVRIPKEQEIKKKISDVRCKTMQDCTLTAAEQETVTAKVEARMTILMNKYDTENNTLELKPHDVMTAAQEAERLAKEAAKAKTAADVSANPATDVNSDSNSTQVLLQLMEARDRDEENLYKYSFESDQVRLPSAHAWDDVYSRESPSGGNSDVTMMDVPTEDVGLTVDDIMDDVSLGVYA